MTAQSLLGAISRASLTNMLLRTNLVDTAQLFEFNFSANTHGFLNRPGEAGERVPEGNPTVTYLHGQLYADFLGDKLTNVDVDTYTFDSPGNPYYRDRLLWR